MFVDGTGNVSIDGATGLENIYIVNGLNVTGMRDGQPRERRLQPRRRHQPPHSSSSPRSTSTAAATRPSTAARWAASSTPSSSRAATSSTAACSATGRPTGCRRSPNVVALVGSSLGSVRKPDFDTSIGVEVGGPHHQGQAVLLGRLRAALHGHPRLPPHLRADRGPEQSRAAAARRQRQPGRHELTDWRARIHESRQTYSYAATLDWMPLPDNHLTFGDLRHAQLQQPDAHVRYGPRVHLQPGLGAGEPHQDQHGLHAALGLEAVRSPLDHRGDRRPAPRGLQRSFAQRRPQRPATSSSTGARTCGTSSTRPAASPPRRDGRTSFQPCPVEPQLPPRRLRPDQASSPASAGWAR